MDIYPYCMCLKPFYFHYIGLLTTDNKTRKQKVIINRKPREIMYLLASVHPSVCLFVRPPPSHS